jgi:hypothetical protein
MDNELNLQESVKGRGVWYHSTNGPLGFSEASANIAVGNPHTNLASNVVLVFNGSAGTGDVATENFVVPSNFKIDVALNNQCDIQHRVWAGNVSQNNSATNDNLTLLVEYRITPGPTASSRTPFNLTETICTLGSTVLGTTPASWYSEFRTDVVALCTEAQRKLLVPGTVIAARFRPNETVATNVSLVVVGTQWSWLGNLANSNMVINTTTA